MIEAIRRFDKMMRDVFLRDRPKPRLKTFDIAGDVLLKIMSSLCHGSVIWRPADGTSVRMSGIPEGVKLLAVNTEQWGETRVVNLVLEHESFDECEEGERILPLDVTVHQVWMEDMK